MKMMTSAELLQLSMNQLNWTMDQFDAGPASFESQSTAETWSQQMPEFQFNQSNCKTPVELPISLSSGDYCFAAFNGIVVIILCIIGFLTNLITIFGLRRDPEKDNATIWLLKTLAVVDNVYLSLLFVALPMETMAKYRHFTDVMMKICSYIFLGLMPLVLIFHILTVWIVVLVTVARYLCIIRPMDIKWRNLRQMKVAVIWLLILAILLNIPTFIDVIMRIYNREKCRDSDFQIQTTNSSTCSTIERFQRAIWFSFVILNSVFGFFIPLIILITLNLRIALALRTLKEKRRQMSLQMIRERSLTKTLVVVVGVFAVCQMPVSVIYFIIDSFDLFGEAPVACALSISHCLVVLNSPINFLIYGLFSTRFKQIFSDMLPSCHKLQKADVVLIE